MEEAITVRRTKGQDYRGLHETWEWRQSGKELLCFYERRRRIAHCYQPIYDLHLWFQSMFFKRRAPGVNRKQVIEEAGAVQWKHVEDVCFTADRAADGGAAGTDFALTRASVELSSIDVMWKIPPHSFGLGCLRCFGGFSFSRFVNSIPLETLLLTRNSH